MLFGMKYRICRNELDEGFEVFIGYEFIMELFIKSFVSEGMLIGIW